MHSLATHEGSVFINSALPAMNKSLLITIITLCAITAKADENKDSGNRDFMLLNHWSIGVTFGSTGIGADLATTFSDFMQLRGGVEMFPKKITYNQDFQIKSSSNHSYGIVHGEAKPNLINGKALLTLYPGRSTKVPVGITGGVFIGTTECLSLSATGNLPANGTVLTLNGYDIPVVNGKASLTLNAKKVKPYVGLTFGRSVPKNKHVGFMMDLGAMLWGTPYITNTNGTQINQIKGAAEADDVLKVINKLKVYPVLSFRLNGRFL